MSYFEAQNPLCDSKHPPQPIDIEIIPRSIDLGGFQVGRVLPSTQKKTVGPFIFWDAAGPGEFLKGKGIDVRPHPHICLSTMTYLYKGVLEHRDSLGNHQIIKPGDVNLMTAGCGIAHSERTPQAERNKHHQLFGIQCWLALPINKEEMQPSFTHYDKKVFPVHGDKGFTLRIVAGEWMGEKSPVITQNDALFVEYTLDAASKINIPASIEERAIYIIDGEINIDNVHYAKNRMLVLKTGSVVCITALTDATIIILGGSALEQPRYLWWNFVASNKERIEQAKQDWLNGMFGKIPGDDKDFIPYLNSNQSF